MQVERPASNDACAAGLHQFAAAAANILYSLKGDLGSFLAQSGNISRSDIASVYYLHTRDNMVEALEDLRKVPVEAKNMIMKSDYPEAVKFNWLLFIVFFENFLKTIQKHKVRSAPEHYVVKAQKLLDTINSFQRLTQSFSDSVELFAVRQNMNGGLKQLVEFEDVFARTYKLAKDCLEKD